MRKREEVKVCHLFVTSQIKYPINFKSNSHIHYTVVIQFNIKASKQDMASHQPRMHYDCYTPKNYHPTDSVPLRSKPFSHLDNLPQGSNKNLTLDHSPNSQNVDKIAEIKKKYDKLLSKGVTKQNQASENLPVQHHKSISGLENNKWEQSKKTNISVHTNFDKNTVTNYEKPSTPIKRQTYSRDYCAPKTQQKKSTLEQNRVALSAMKSELQARLNELSAKTIMNSSIRQQNHDLQEFIPVPPTKASRDETYKNYTRTNPVSNTSTEKFTDYSTKNTQKQDFSNKYDKILLKYKQQLQKPSRERQKRDERSKYQEKTKVTSCLSKYMNPSKNEKEIMNKQQLSVISQKSNSNNSEIIVDNSVQLQDKLKENAEVKMSYVRQIVDVRNDDIFRKTVDQSIRNKRERQSQVPYSYENKYAQRKTSLTTTNNQVPNSNNYSRQKNYPNNTNTQSIYQEENQNSKQFTLKKLENNVGPIKRTTTQQHFVNFNKANVLQNREQPKQKQKIINNYVNPMSKNKDMNKNQSKYGLHLEVELGEATFGKKNQKHPVYQATPSALSHQKNVNQIEKLKERYAKNTQPATSSNTPPGTSSNHDKSASKIEQERQSSKKPTWKNYQFKDNQQISNKIDKLDKKIKEIQNNKKNLNISFQPFQSKINTKSSYNYDKSAEKYDKSDLSEKYKAKYGKPENHSTIFQKEQEINPRARISSYYQKVRPIYSDITVPEAAKTHTNGFSIKLMPVQTNTEQSRQLNECSFSDINSKSQIKQEYLNKMQFELKADTGIEERKKKLKEKVQTSNNIKYLVKIFGQQAVFDEIFRNNKIWFASEKSSSKWENLQKELNNYNINLSESQVRYEFQLTQSQNNPFFSVSDSKCDTKTLVSSYNQAKKHWQEKIYKKFDRTSLQKQGLNSSKLDFDKKGYILIEDLVRFFNIESGTFLRNRDVSIIFKRIKKSSDRINFDELMQAVST